MRFKRSVLMAAFLGVSVSAAAKWAIAPDMPVAAVASKYRKLVQKQPRNAHAWYVLGRVHSVAFSTGEEKVAVYQNGAQIDFPGYMSIRVPYRDKAPMTAERRDHLVRSLYAYKRATKLNPKDALAFLGLGWMHEMAVQVPGTSRSHRDAALQAYRKVVDLRKQAELGYPHYGVGDDSRLAMEAAAGIVRLFGNTNNREVIEMKELVARLEKIPQAISPIIVPLRGETTLDALLSDATSRFDVAGDGIPREWEWVRPETGILCWDPRGTGQITSGRQLFGTATWWMFFSDGYEALAALDANGDGWLRGSELFGISVWQDLNVNGLSDPGEVVPVAAHRISGLSVNATGRGPKGPWTESGVEFLGGRLAPSYDWIPTGKPRP